MIPLALSLIVVGYVPGAMLMRLPVGDRSGRERLESDERAFWGVALSLAWSLALSFLLGFAGWDSWPRLLAVSAAVSALMFVVWRGRLRYRQAPPLSRYALVPMVLAAAALWLFPP